MAAIHAVRARPRFVIVTTGRTGSELLASLLNAHLKVVCESEILALWKRFPIQRILSRSVRPGLRGRAYQLENFDEVAELLSRTRYAGLLPTNNGVSEKR
jgi:hypothetical protein